MVGDPCFLSSTDSAVCVCVCACVCVCVCAITKHRWTLLILTHRLDFPKSYNSQAMSGILMEAVRELSLFSDEAVLVQEPREDS